MLHVHVSGQWHDEIDDAHVYETKMKFCGSQTPRVLHNVVGVEEDEDYGHGDGSCNTKAGLPH
jgi:hypothetical protein